MASFKSENNMMKISITHQVQGREENIKIENIISDNVTIGFGSESVSLRSLLDIYNHASHSKFDDVRELLQTTNKKTQIEQTEIILEKYNSEGRFSECDKAIDVLNVLFPNLPKGITAPKLPPPNGFYTTEEYSTIRYIYQKVITKWLNENMR